MTSMSGKTVLVTGATNGVGEATARALAAQGAHVLLHGRNPQKGGSLVADIQSRSGNPAVEFVQADFASLASVRALAADIERRVPKLDVLINNAGRVERGFARTQDGFEAMFGVNHLAPFLLTNLLLDRITTSAPSRIVNVASAAHRGAPLDFDNLNFEKGGFNVWTGYHRSKLANVLFNLALAKRLQGTGVTANALHPGAVRSGLGQDRAGPMTRLAAGAVMAFMISAEEGAKTSVYLASSPEVEGVSGRYFAKSKPVRPHPSAEDAAAAERLWEASAKLVGLG